MQCRKNSVQPAAVQRARHVAGYPGQDQRVDIRGIPLFFPVAEQGCGPLERSGNDGRPCHQRQHGVEIGSTRSPCAGTHVDFPAPFGACFGTPCAGTGAAANANRRNSPPPAIRISRRSLRFGSIRDPSAPARLARGVAKAKLRQMSRLTKFPRGIEHCRTAADASSRNHARASSRAGVLRGNPPHLRTCHCAGRQGPLRPLLRPWRATI